MKLKDWLTIIIMFVPAIVAACIKDYELMGILAGVSLVTVIFINIDRLKSIKAFGIEAEMRDAIKEVYATIDQMKELQTTETKIMLNLICKRRYVLINDLQQNTEDIKNILVMAKKIKNEENIQIECRKAMAKLVGMELAEFIEVMNVSKEKKEILKKYYRDDPNSNLLEKGIKIPTFQALEESQLLQTNVANLNFGRHYNDYKYIVTEYERLFGKDDLTDHISLEGIKEQ